MPVTAPAHAPVPLLRLSLWFACSALLASAALHAAEQETIATDRPDFTESSIVVGQGRFQIETSVAVERDSANGIKERTASTPTLLRFGVSETLELRVETDGRLVARSENMATGSSVTERGYGDTSLGVKWHVHDASAGMPSVALLGEIELDSGSAPFRGDGLRPALLMTAEWELPDEFSLGVMPGLRYGRNERGERFVGGIVSVVLGKSWNERLRTFVEVAAPRLARSTNGGTAASVTIGAACLLSDTLQIDTALSKGNKNTADLSWTIGLSAKF